MKKSLPHFIRHLGAAALIAASALGAQAAVSMQLDRSDIGSDETAELTVNASGSAITPPSVNGLQFTPVSQSSQIEIINGSVNSTSTVTFEIVAQAPGNYTIPTGDGSKLTLHVHAGSGGGSAPQVSTTPPQSVGSPLPAPAIQGATPNAPHMVENGAAFVRMQMPSHDLYVGETVPVDIQVGLRAGMAATLNGLPALSADAFTLNKLSDKPEETEEEINGQPYTILTWHSILAAVKPGDFSLAVQTPVTVQVRTGAPRMSGDGSDPFNNPFFQSFFSGVTQKELTLSNDPTAVKVLPLPTTGQPTDFTGAVGAFTAMSEISAPNGTVGEPLTLRLKVNGAGSFDRVESPMLGSTDGWKTYRSSGKLTPADSVGYRGEKDFEQAIIPQRAGHQTVPALAFSFFNPETKQYETLHTAPISIEVEPGAMASTAPAIPSAQPTANATPAAPTKGMRPDMIETGMAISTLRPLYFQPGFLVAQAALALSFIGAGIWLRRSERAASDPSRNQRRHDLKAVEAFLSQMDSAANQRDAATFFFSARQALQYSLASKWKMTPAAITLAEIDTRLDGNDENIHQIFTLADELAYSGGTDIDTDFPAWKQAVHQTIKETL
jgi:hypothetical protein